MTATSQTTSATAGSTAQNLSDTHRVLLAAAGQRPDGTVLPVPDGLKARGAALQRALGKLLALGFVEEFGVAAEAPLWREAEGTRFGLRITDAGKRGIGIAGEPEAPGEVPDEETDEVPAGTGPALRATPRSGTKGAALAALLARPGGAAMDELTAALGWLPHTVRAAMTGLRRKGLDVQRVPAAEGRPATYRIVGPAAAEAADAA